jgi:SAM-dependent methyltransferase
MPDDTRQEMVHHYASGYEARRLHIGSGVLERARTLELLDRFLPPPPADVLDVGGGTGAYALPLLEKGYAVDLIDATPLHVQLAREAMAGRHGGRGRAREGDARRLEQPDASVDAALLLGPLYHLVDRGERLQALREARRALRPGGRLLAVSISRFASALDGLFGGELDDPAFAAIVDRDLTDGQHRNPTDKPEYFTTTFFHHPDELRAEVTEAGFRLDALVAVEGPAWMLHDLERHWASDERRARLLALTRRIEAEPALLGASAHVLAAATR